MDLKYLFPGGEVPRACAGDERASFLSGAGGGACREAGLFKGRGPFVVAFFLDLV
ncbi:hypothetical protein LAWASA_1788 [Lawsonibacter asaccharolyticus]|nr:hypothetical protein LAWASA_1788 [Lawsonibacter asaccharolyticus]